MAVTFQMRVKIIYYWETSVAPSIDAAEIQTRFENMVFPAMENGLKKYQSPTIKVLHFQRKLKVSEHDGWFNVYPKLAFDLTSMTLPKGEARVFIGVVLDDYVEAFKAGFPELVGYAYVRYRQAGTLTETLITA